MEGLLPSLGMEGLLPSLGVEGLLPSLGVEGLLPSLDVEGLLLSLGVDQEIYITIPEYGGISDWELVKTERNLLVDCFSRKVLTVLFTAKKILMYSLHQGT